MYNIFKPALISLFILIFGTSFAQNTLRYHIAELAKPAKGIVGVSVLNIENGDTLNYNGNTRMVMHSVMKFPIALSVLHLVDSGVFKLDQVIKVKKKDLSETAVSPLREKYPKGGDVPLSELLTYMIANSDNDACDILLGMLTGLNYTGSVDQSGTDQVNQYLHSIKVKGINLGASEQEMAKSWPIQYTNWCKPVDMVKLLEMFYSGKILKPGSRDFLYKIMTQTTRGTNRIRALLPPGTVVADKTGSSGTNDAGLSPATNDVGIITLPNSKHIAIAIFVCNSMADEATRESVIAKIAKAVYDDELK
jgi:beta-lactamase class A